MEVDVKILTLPVSLAFLAVGLLLGGCFAGAVHGNYLAPEQSQDVVPARQVKIGNYYWISKTFHLGKFSSKMLTVLCPTGYIVLGGGANFTNVGSNVINFDASAPNSNFTGWTVSTGEQDPITVNVYASCAPKA